MKIQFPLKHIANIYEKLHINSNKQMMELAFRNKLS
jgi:DNA-binding CsgD family transcriptional regulator